MARLLIIIFLICCCTLVHAQRFKFKPTITKAKPFTGGKSDRLRRTKINLRVPILQQRSLSRRGTLVNQQVARWNSKKTILRADALNKAIRSNSEYELFIENGVPILYNSGRSSTKFNITSDVDKINITRVSQSQDFETKVRLNQSRVDRKLTRDDEVELLIGKDIFESGKIIVANDVKVSVTHKGNKYPIETVKMDGQIHNMAVVGENFWIGLQTTDLNLVLRNLSARVQKGSMKVVSTITDATTNSILKTGLGSNAQIFNSKAEFVKFCTTQSEGNTIFIVGHHSNGRIISKNIFGKTQYEITPAEIEILSARHKINFFPIGCETGMSKFGQGANIALNSKKVALTFSKHLLEANSYEDILIKLAGIDSRLKFILSEKSFKMKIKMVEIQRRNYPTTRQLPDSTRVVEAYQEFFASVIALTDFSRFNIVLRGEGLSSILATESENHIFDSVEEEFQPEESDAWERYLVYLGFSGIAAIFVISRMKRARKEYEFYIEGVIYFLSIWCFLIGCNA